MESLSFSLAKELFSLYKIIFCIFIYFFLSIGLEIY